MEPLLFARPHSRPPMFLTFFRMRLIFALWKRKESSKVRWKYCREARKSNIFREILPQRRESLILPSKRDTKTIFYAYPAFSVFIHRIGVVEDGIRRFSALRRDLQRQLPKSVPAILDHELFHSSCEKHWKRIFCRFFRNPLRGSCI